MPRGLTIALYGIEGSGKTTFALQFPKPMIVIPIREPGLDNLEMMGDVPPGVISCQVKDFNDICVATAKAECRTLVIDSLSGFQSELVKEVTKVEYNGNTKAFDGYSSGMRQSVPRWVDNYIDQLEFLARKGTNIIFIAHRKVTTDPDATGPDSLMNVPFGDQAVYGPVVKWASAILFLSYKKQIEMATKIAGKGDNATVLEGKASNAVTRVMYCGVNGTNVAKNLLHLPPVIPMGTSAADSYQKFLAALPPKLQEIMKK